MEIILKGWISLKKHNFKFLAVTSMLLVLFVTLFISVSASLGDINSDDKINASDARAILRISAKLEKVTDEVKKNADINADGNVTSADARIALRISAKLDMIDNYITAPEIINAEITYSITDDGYFIGGESSATINIVPDADCDTAQVEIIDVADEVAYAVTLENLKQDIATTFEWNGKIDDINYANSGSYKVVVTINETESVVDGLEFTKTNYFSGGNGSENKPFLVASIAEFENIVRFPNANYKQVNDFDYEYGAAKSLFTSDAPFNGAYDGNGYAFKNILSTNPLISYNGQNSVIKNVKITDSSFSCSSVLTYANYGKITDCDIDANVTLTLSKDNNFMGMICRSNVGLILNCKTSGIVSATATETQACARAGGIAASNSGKIINCVTDVDVSATATNNYWGGIYAGGIVAVNESGGFIQNTEAKGTVFAVSKRGLGSSDVICPSGGIAGSNNGQITNCIYTGSSNIKLSGEGSGIVS